MCVEILLLILEIHSEMWIQMRYSKLLKKLKPIFIIVHCFEKLVLISLDINTIQLSFILLLEISIAHGYFHL